MRTRQPRPYPTQLSRQAGFPARQPVSVYRLHGWTLSGYVVDHIVPLKRDGADDPSNMQWQGKVEAKAKDRID